MGAKTAGKTEFQPGAAASKLKLGTKATSRIARNAAKRDVATSSLVTRGYWSSARSKVRQGDWPTSRLDVRNYDLIMRPSPSLISELSIAGAPLFAAPPVQVMMSPSTTVLRVQP